MPNDDSDSDEDGDIVNGSSDEDELEMDFSMAVDSESGHFTGDYFGGLQDEDFDWQEGQGGDGDEQMDDDELEGDEDEELEEDEDEELEEDEDDGDLYVYEDLQEPRSDTPHQSSSPPPPAPLHQSTPEHIKHFQGRAGAPLPGHGDPGYTTYGRESLGESGIWDPFHSRTDWEFARWAKLRGPSSTAVSDLLKIDGVSASSLFIAPR